MKSPSCIIWLLAFLLSPILVLASGQSEGGLVINEFMADNDGAVPGPYMTFPDWIEIYNGGSTSIDLSGMILTEDLTSPPWRFPNGTILAPGEFLIVWGNRGSGPDMLHTNFSPNANGGTLTLLAADGTTVIDQVTFKKQIRDVSYGRIPDGASTWCHLVNPTPGKPNIANPQTGIATNWLIWAFIGGVLAVCAFIVIHGRKRSK
ncbi:MAG: lamin tail domain-containing protein [Candidatus Bathyarchaeia archaeon]